MPELITFAICEKAIVAEDRTISLITLFQGITLAPDFAIPVSEPGNPMGITLPWSAYAVWRKEDTDEDKIFEQRLAVQVPSGIRLVLNLVEFSFTTRTHTTLVTLAAWPIADVGEYEVLLEVREKRKSTRFRKAAYSLVNVHRGKLS
jgi:hypothetical protein